MASLPKEQDVLIDAYGPHLNRMEGLQLDTGVQPDKVVNTHCCFCGQQCGIQLKVKDNAVIGFEPWYAFPFNKGMLCPKGVKRYLQGNHPDRLITALERDPSSDTGFRPIAYDEAIRKVATAIDRIQSAYGPNAFGVLSGASLTTEKAYLMGKFARVCLKTKYIDYNGRLCMVSAGAANKKAFGIDRAANPWSDILNAEVVVIAGSNTAECAPITTNYVWQARENGGKVIVVDPRITPIARTCGRLPAGQAGPRRRALQRHPATDDRERLARPRLHREPHGRVRGGGRTRQAMDAETDGGGDRRRREVDPPGRGAVGAGEDELPDARPRHRAPLSWRGELPQHDQHRAGLGAHRARVLRLRNHRRPGQRTGRPRARAEVRSTPRLAGHQQSGPPRVHRRRLGR